MQDYYFIFKSKEPRKKARSTYYCTSNKKTKIKKTKSKESPKNNEPITCQYKQHITIKQVYLQKYFKSLGKGRHFFFPFCKFF